MKTKPAHNKVHNSSAITQYKMTQLSVDTHHCWMNRELVENTSASLANTPLLAYTLFVYNVYCILLTCICIHNYVYQCLLRTIILVPSNVLYIAYVYLPNKQNYQLTTINNVRFLLQHYTTVYMFHLARKRRILQGYCKQPSKMAGDGSDCNEANFYRNLRYYA